MPKSMAAGGQGSCAVRLVQLVLVLAMLLPLAAQGLSIETLHLPDTHSPQSHRAPGLTTLSETGLIAAISVVPIAALDSQDIDVGRSHRPPIRPVEAPEHPPR
jgi:hypothetical protein